MSEEFVENGLLLTEELVKSFGGKKIFDVSYELKLRGHLVRMTKNDSPPHPQMFWNCCFNFDVNGYRYCRVRYLPQLLEFIAEESFRTGVQDGKRQIREALGC